MLIPPQKMPARVLSAAVVLTLASVLAGCGSGGDSSAAPLPATNPFSTYDIITLASGGGTVSSTGITADGKIAATIAMPDGSRHAYLYDGSSMIDLGTMGGNASEATGINKHGHVVGWVRFKDASHAFLYDGAMHDLGTLGGADSFAQGINDNGQVTGRSTAADGATRAFLYQNGTMEPVKSPGIGSAGWAINAGGQVAGDYVASDGSHHGFLSGICDCIQLGTLGGAESIIYALNDAGQAAGAADTPQAQRHAFLYKDAALRDLGTLGGAGSSAAAINAGGKVVGKADTGNGDTQAFVYDGAALKALGLLSGRRSAASAINASGLVVGFATTATGEEHAILWSESEGPVDLNQRIPGAPAGTVLKGAYAVSDNGSIVAGGNIGLVLLKKRAP
ncbi:MAG: hypothetical protein JWP34_2170 [Massilia sp.]|nr:hypothetical protein [Massilia sp.]